MAIPAVERKAIEGGVSEIHRHFGGSSQSDIAPSNKAQVIFLISRKSCEQSGYTDEVDPHGVYSYAGEGQVGDMMPNRAYLAAQQHAATGQASHLLTLGD